MQVQILPSVFTILTTCLCSQTEALSSLPMYKVNERNMNASGCKRELVVGERRRGRTTFEETLSKAAQTVGLDSRRVTSFLIIVTFAGESPAGVLDMASTRASKQKR